MVIPSWSALSYGLLSGAVCALWVRLGPWWLWIALALGSAWIGGLVNASGLVGALALGISVACRYREGGGRRARVAGVIGTVGLAVAFMLHRWPGFFNVQVLDRVRLSADAVPYSLYLNFDKTLLGLLLVAWGQQRVATAGECVAMVKAGWLVALGTLAVVLVLSLIFGYIRFDPKWPTWVWLWAVVNLFSTCLAEEAFFRGFVQGGLVPWVGRGWALGVAALAFGLAHAAGGPLYVGLAAVAGLGYGWVYQRTGRIEASMVTHFMVNAVHLTLFTYPALAAAVRSPWA